MNIIWVFHIQNYSYPSDQWNQPKEYYPGDDYVDWLAMSAYGKQFKKDPWILSQDSMTWAYDDLCSINSNKSVMLAEWGIVSFPRTVIKRNGLRERFR